MSAYLSHKYAKIGYIVLLVLIVIFYIIPVSVPIIAAYLTAALLHPAAEGFRRTRNLTHKTSIALVFMAFILMISALAYLVTAAAITEGSVLLQKIPELIAKVEAVWTDKEQTNFYGFIPQALLDNISLQSSKAIETARNGLATFLNLDYLTASISKIPELMISFLIYLVAVYLFLAEIPSLKKRMYSHLTSKSAKKITFISSRMTTMLAGFLKAQLMMGAIIFSIALTGFLFIYPKYAVIAAALVALVDFIPFAGSIIILGPWALFHYLTGDIPGGTQLAGLSCMLLIVRRALEPKITGSHIGLSPLYTLISMYLGYKLLGLYGIIIGPSLVAASFAAKEAGLFPAKFKQ
ncbi:sporulation integral membrane protein YtvI [Peribacillus sp. SCS-37]|uniref:sporulation integral membrane protein YtvI n=1 Tax=Paraperibacillus esterisolvens TaxID=3115296 RepID=UPI0039065E4A